MSFCASQDEVISFPLYSEAIKFVHHEENMVRIAVRALTLNIYHGSVVCLFGVMHLLCVIISLVQYLLVLLFLSYRTFQLNF
jgi:hypothetical protein